MAKIGRALSTCGVLLACVCHCSWAFLPPSMARLRGVPPSLHSHTCGARNMQQGERAADRKDGGRTRLRCADESLASAPVARSPATDKSLFWDWKYNSRIHYTCTGTEGPPLLLLTGFGVGSFHYSRNVDELARTHRVWTMDILGQGKSWPKADPAPGGGYTEKGFEWGFGPDPSAEADASKLNYSCSLWADQVVDFLEAIVKTGPVYVAGNSLGGYLAVMVASRRPELVKGLFLMNPTPFWGVGVQRLLPWTGGYPVPSWVRPVTITWWDTIRSASTIRQILGGVYASEERVGSELISQIIAPTEAPAAASAFASILCSPSSPKKFKDMLADIEAAAIPVALTYGKEDPWIVPLWGFRAKRSLPCAKYWEISPAGHCPHHEAPEAVNWLLAQWIAATDAGDEAALDAIAPRDVASDEVEYGLVGGAGAGFKIVECDGSPRSLSEHFDAFVFRMQGGK